MKTGASNSVARQREQTPLSLAWMAWLGVLAGPMTMSLSAREISEAEDWFLTVPAALNESSVLVEGFLKVEKTERPSGRTDYEGYVQVKRVIFSKTTGEVGRIRFRVSHQIYNWTPDDILGQTHMEGAEEVVALVGAMPEKEGLWATIIVPKTSVRTEELVRVLQFFSEEVPDLKAWFAKVEDFKDEPLLASVLINAAFDPHRLGSFDEEAALIAFKRARRESDSHVHLDGSAFADAAEWILFSKGDQNTRLKDHLVKLMMEQLGEVRDADTFLMLYSRFLGRSTVVPDYVRKHPEWWPSIEDMLAKTSSLRSDNKEKQEAVESSRMALQSAISGNKSGRGK